MQQASFSVGTGHPFHTCTNISVRTLTAAVRQDKARKTWLQSQMEVLAPPQPQHVVKASSCLIWQFTIPVTVLYSENLYGHSRVCFFASTSLLCCLPAHVVLYAMIEVRPSLLVDSSFEWRAGVWAVNRTGLAFEVVGNVLYQ